MHWTIFTRAHSFFSLCFIWLRSVCPFSFVLCLLIPPPFIYSLQPVLVRFVLKAHVLTGRSRSSRHGQPPPPNVMGMPPLGQQQQQPPPSQSEPPRRVHQPSQPPTSMGMQPSYHPAANSYPPMPMNQAMSKIHISSMFLSLPRVVENSGRDYRYQQLYRSRSGGSSSRP